MMISLIFAFFFFSTSLAAQIAYQTTVWKGVKYSVVQCNPKDVQFFLDDEKGRMQNFDRLANYVAKRGETLLFAMNGGMYLPKDNNSPQGLYIEKGNTHTSIDTFVHIRPLKTNFYLHPNGVFSIDKSNKAHILSTADYIEQRLNRGRDQYATQSGPLLVYQNKIHEIFNPLSKSKYIRNAVGLDRDGHLYFVVSHQPVRLYDIASLFTQKLSCPNALYLDGYISKMYYPIDPLFRDIEQGNFGVMIGITEK